MDKTNCCTVLESITDMFDQANLPKGWPQGQGLRPTAIAIAKKRQSSSFCLGLHCFDHTQRRSANVLIWFQNVGQSNACKERIQFTILPNILSHYNIQKGNKSMKYILGHQRYTVNAVV